MNSHVGIEDVNSIGEGGGQLAESSSMIQLELNRMMDEMEAIHRAVKGETETSFANAKNELGERFSELMLWCSQNGMKLGEGQSALTGAVSETSESVQGVAQDIGGLARNPNR